ncbi:unnamed protein product [Cladocopium goreaui]|uniref:Uncharacterized protein n=1 Tax=Cladocopium goreaui TaxID=2562237 RepID=A0A9P1CY11_9DINO|nr:unnamed protein product [Cladocopium goreaui]
MRSGLATSPVRLDDAAPARADDADCFLNSVRTALWLRFGLLLWTRLCFGSWTGASFGHGTSGASSHRPLGRKYLHPAKYLRISGSRQGLLSRQKLHGRPCHRPTTCDDFIEDEPFSPCWSSSSSWIGTDRLLAPTDQHAEAWGHLHPIATMKASRIVLHKVEQSR